MQPKFEMATTANPIVIPIAQAYPVFASIQPLKPPPEFDNIISPELWGIINSSSTWTIRQRNYSSYLKLLDIQ